MLSMMMEKVRMCTCRDDDAAGPRGGYTVKWYHVKVPCTRRWLHGTRALGAPQPLRRLWQAAGYSDEVGGKGGAREEGGEGGATGWQVVLGHKQEHKEKGEGSRAREAREGGGGGGGG